MRAATAAPWLGKIIMVRVSLIPQVQRQELFKSKFKNPDERDTSRDHQMGLDSRASSPPRDKYQNNNDKLLGNDEQRSVPLPIPVPKAVNAMDNTSDTSYSSSMSSNASGTDSDVSASTSTTSAAELLSPGEHKRAMLDRLMNHFLTLRMSKKVNGEQVPTGTPTPSSTSSAQASSSAQNGGSASASRKGKRPMGCEPHGEESGSDEEEEEEGDGPPNRKRQKNGKAEQRRLACPFFKRNPQRYKEKRSCVAPGFRTVHRLKQVTLSPPF